MANGRHTESAAMMAFFAGAVIAAGVTLLLTPTRGKEVRERLGDVKEEAMRKLQECAKEAKFRVSRKTKEDALNYDGGAGWI